MWWLVCFLCCASKFCADGRNVPTKKFHQLSSCKKEHQTSATGPEGKVSTMGELRHIHALNILQCSKRMEKEREGVCFRIRFEV